MLAGRQLAWLWGRQGRRQPVESGRNSEDEAMLETTDRTEGIGESPIVMMNIRCDA